MRAPMSDYVVVRPIWRQFRSRWLARAVAHVRRGGFAAIALILAAAGLYGVLSYTVAQRTSEIGLRMALGAQARNVLGVVLRSTARVVAAGLAIGLVGAFGLSSLLGAVLPSMATDTGVVGVIAAAVLIAAAFLACYLPARRATRVDPMVALRTN